jgi:hypothetical protein
VGNTIKTWFGEVTTGHGFMIIAGALLSVVSGATTWAAAAPFLAAGVVGLLWPENTALQTAAQAAITDLAGMLSAYNNKNIRGGTSGSIPPG